jgi:hypothetical protein
VTAFDPHASLVGSTVGPWLILERLDSGSFGIVYRARRAGHPDSPPVVVKMAKRPKDARFEREVELLQHSPHPGIPRFEDAGLWTAPDGQRYPYVVMELPGRAPPAMCCRCSLRWRGPWRLRTLGVPCTEEP